MADTEREVVPGLTNADIGIIAGQIFNRKDGNHPQLKADDNGFLDILQNGKSDLSASPAFIKKADL